MDVSKEIKEQILRGDYKSEAEEEYVKKLKKTSKRELFVKIGLGTLYIALLLGSLLVV